MYTTELGWGSYGCISSKRSHSQVICLALGRGYFSLVFGKNRARALGINLFFNIKFSHVFLIKSLSIKLCDKNRNMHTFYKKNSKVQPHSTKSFFWWPSSNFAIFSSEMSVTFDFGQDILCLEHP